MQRVLQPPAGGLVCTAVINWWLLWLPASRGIARSFPSHVHAMPLCLKHVGCCSRTPALQPGSGVPETSIPTLLREYFKVRAGWVGVACRQSWLAVFGGASHR